MIGHLEINKLKLNLRKNMEVSLFPCYMFKIMCKPATSSILRSSLLPCTIPIFSKTPVCEYDVHTCSPECQRSITGVFLHHSLPHILRQISLNLEIANLPGHSDRKASGVGLSPSPSTGEHLHPLCQPFAGILQRRQGLM